MENTTEETRCKMPRLKFTFVTQGFSKLKRNTESWEFDKM